jgi:hypothetical protein
MTVATDDLIPWLLDGDPAIRWRVHRDLLDSPVSTVNAERERIATEGLTLAWTRIDGWKMRSLPCGTRVEPTAVGPRTPDIPVATGFGWRTPVRAGGTPTSAPRPELVGHGWLSRRDRPATLGQCVTW